MTRINLDRIAESILDNIQNHPVNPALWGLHNPSIFRVIAQTHTPTGVREFIDRVFPTIRGTTENLLAVIQQHINREGIINTGHLGVIIPLYKATSNIINLFLSTGNTENNNFREATRLNAHIINILSQAREHENNRRFIDQALGDFEQQENDPQQRTDRVLEEARPIVNQVQQTADAIRRERQRTPHQQHVDRLLDNLEENPTQWEFAQINWADNIRNNPRLGRTILQALLAPFLVRAENILLEEHPQEWYQAIARAEFAISSLLSIVNQAPSGGNPIPLGGSLIDTKLNHIGQEANRLAEGDTWHLERFRTEVTNNRTPRHHIRIILRDIERRIPLQEWLLAHGVDVQYINLTTQPNELNEYREALTQLLEASIRRIFGEIEARHQQGQTLDSDRDTHRIIHVILTNANNYLGININQLMGQYIQIDNLLNRQARLQARAQAPHYFQQPEPDQQPEQEEIIIDDPDDTEEESYHDIVNIITQDLSTNENRPNRWILSNNRFFTNTLNECGVTLPDDEVGERLLNTVLTHTNQALDIVQGMLDIPNLEEHNVEDARQMLNNIGQALANLSRFFSSEHPQIASTINRLGRIARHTPLDHSLPDPRARLITPTSRPTFSFRNQPTQQQGFSQLSDSLRSRIIALGTNQPTQERLRSETSGQPIPLSPSTTLTTPFQQLMTDIIHQPPWDWDFVHYINLEDITDQQFLQLEQRCALRIDQTHMHQEITNDELSTILGVINILETEHNERFDSNNQRANTVFTTLTNAKKNARIEMEVRRTRANQPTPEQREFLNIVHAQSGKLSTPSQNQNLFTTNEYKQTTNLLTTTPNVILNDAILDELQILANVFYGRLRGLQRIDKTLIYDPKGLLKDINTIRNNYDVQDHYDERAINDAIHILQQPVSTPPTTTQPNDIVNYLSSVTDPEGREIYYGTSSTVRNRHRIITELNSTFPFTPQDLNRIAQYDGIQLEGFFNALNNLNPRGWPALSYALPAAMYRHLIYYYHTALDRYAQQHPNSDSDIQFFFDKLTEWLHTTGHRLPKWAFNLVATFINNYLIAQGHPPIQLFHIPANN